MANDAAAAGQLTVMEGGHDVQALVAVSVQTSNAGEADPVPRAWRMRITVQRVGDRVKVSDVGFVP